MMILVCPVCGATFRRSPSDVQPANYCSRPCMGTAHADAADDLAGFDPGPPVGPHDASFIDPWRKARVRFELARKETTS